jgi:hypothetical protein
MGMSYETDVFAWAHEQAALLRNGDLAALDTVNLADEIEAMARSEKRELKRRVAILFAHLLRWQSRPSAQCDAWRISIRMQREAADELFAETPSLQALKEDPRLLRLAWLDAVSTMALLLGHDLPDASPWSVAQALDNNFWPH